ncbi:MAG: hypothetical protein QOJ85_752 [Solirubrobacteraceae bacterium]|jgi:type II secretory pathway pseudopilin PulG|nr:hypothetical protein [Solirubrobacteraceae bacterium]
MPSKLKPVLLLALAGGVVAAVRRRASRDQIQQAATQAAGKASDIAERAKQAAPEPVKQAVDKVVDKATGGEASGGDGTGSRDETRRFAAPAEAGSQPPTEAGGTPSDDPQPTTARGVPADDLATKAHELPGDTVMPDTSNEDPAVREAEAAAAADAGSIGGNPTETQP